MLMFALTDGLAALGGLCGMFILSRTGRGKLALFAALGLAFFALPATIGTIKFLFGLQAFLETAHVRTTELGSLAGMLLIGFCFLGTINRSTLQRLPLLPTALAGIVLYLATLVLGAYAPAAAAISGLALAASLASGVALLMRKNMAAALRAFLITALMLLIGIAPGLTSDPALSFHIFHIVAAVWFLLMAWHFARLSQAD